MDGLQTHVLAYQSSDGSIHTTRIISSDPEMEGRIGNMRLEGLFHAWGCDLLTTRKVEEMELEIKEPGERRGELKRAGYRLMLAATLLLTGADVAMGYLNRVSIDHRLDNIETAAETLFPYTYKSAKITAFK